MNVKERYRRRANECVRLANGAMNMLLSKGRFRYEETKEYSKLVKQTIRFYKETQSDDLLLDYNLLEAMVNGIVYHIKNEIGSVYFNNSVYRFYLDDYAKDLLNALKLAKSTKLWEVSETDYKNTLIKYGALNRVSRSFKDNSGIPDRHNIRKGTYGIRAIRLG